MKRIMVALAIIMVMLAGCGGGASDPTPTTTAKIGIEVTLPSGSYWRISPVQLASLERTSYLLVCVDEQPAMVINNTDLFVKYTEIAQHLDKFPADKDRRIVVYCISGTFASPPVAEALVAAGYTMVSHLEGGTLRWQQQGYPVVAYTGTPNRVGGGG